MNNGNHADHADPNSQGQEGGEASLPALIGAQDQASQALRDIFAVALIEQTLIEDIVRS